MSIKTFSLNNYREWQKANDNTKFSLYDYIHGLTVEKVIPIDFYIASLKLFNPDFISVDNCIFLKEEYEETKYFDLLKQQYSKRDLEYWINLVNLDGLFDTGAIEIDDSFLTSCLYLGEQLVNLWSSKLYIDFPSKQFHVECIQEANEVYIVFYEQTCNNE